MLPPPHRLSPLSVLVLVCCYWRRSLSGEAPVGDDLVVTRCTELNNRLSSDRDHVVGLKEALQRIQCRRLLEQINLKKIAAVAKPVEFSEELKLYFNNLIKLKNGEMTVNELQEVTVPVAAESAPPSDHFTISFFAKRMASDNVALGTVSSMPGSVTLKMNKNSESYRRNIRDQTLLAAELLVAANGGDGTGESSVAVDIVWSGNHHDYVQRYQLRQRDSRPRLALLDLDVDVIARWLTSPEEQIGLSIRRRDQRRDEFEPEIFGLVLSFSSNDSRNDSEALMQDDEQGGRTKRSVHRSSSGRDWTYRHHSSRRSCHLEEYIIHTTFLQESLSISCEGESCRWKINQCMGVCETPISSHVDVSNHAIINNQLQYLGFPNVPTPCCVPTRYKSKTYMRLDDEQLRTVSLKNVVVSECGCR